MAMATGHFCFAASTSAAGNWTICWGALCAIITGAEAPQLSFHELLDAPNAPELPGFKPKVCPGGGGDCKDSDVKVNPGVTELCADFVDNNCSGQTDEEATANLDAMNKIGNLPWALTFSYGRALQAAPQKAWAGKADNVAAAQSAFMHRAKMNFLAARGEWKADLEKKAA